MVSEGRLEKDSRVIRAGGRTASWIQSHVQQPRIEDMDDMEVTG